MDDTSEGAETELAGPVDLSIARPMGQPLPPLFLERENYRHRRVMDAARLLPVFAAALWLVPVFWSRVQGTDMGMIYLFAIWFAVIVGSAILSRQLTAPLRRRTESVPSFAAPNAPTGNAGTEGTRTDLTPTERGSSARMPAAARPPGRDDAQAGPSGTSGPIPGQGPATPARAGVVGAAGPPFREESPAKARHGGVREMADPTPGASPSPGAGPAPDNGPTPDDGPTPDENVKPGADTGAPDSGSGPR